MSILTREEFSEILDCYAMRAISGYVGGVIGANPRHAEAMAAYDAALARIAELERQLAAWAEFRAQNVCEECNGEPWRTSETDADGKVTFGEPETCPLCDGTGMRFVELQRLADAYEDASVDLALIKGPAYRARIAREFYDEAAESASPHAVLLRWEAAAKEGE